jgi:quercetin dioxygenase-like cupin family protein
VMHRTRTVDYVVVIKGEIVLLLEDSEVTLRQGDVVVQRGTDHAWENRSSAPARMAFFHIDAQFSEDLLQVLPNPLQLMR